MSGNPDLTGIDFRESLKYELSRYISYVQRCHREPGLILEMKMFNAENVLVVLMDLELSRSTLHTFCGRSLLNEWFAFKQTTNAAPVTAGWLRSRPSEITRAETTASAEWATKNCLTSTGCSLACYVCRLPVKTENGHGLQVDAWSESLCADRNWQTHPIPLDGEQLTKTLKNAIEHKNVAALIAKPILAAPNDLSHAKKAMKILIAQCRSSLASLKPHQCHVDPSDSSRNQHAGGFLQGSVCVFCLLTRSRISDRPSTTRWWSSSTSWACPTRAIRWKKLKPYVIVTDEICPWGRWWHQFWSSLLRSELFPGTSIKSSHFIMLVTNFKSKIIVRGSMALLLGKK